VRAALDLLSSSEQKIADFGEKYRVS